jgi:DDE_Tnp_1-associated
MALPSQSAQGQRPDLSIPQYFAQLKDPRRAHRRLHLLQDLIVIALCAVIAGAQDWQQIETFGRKRRGWLRRFLVLPNGIPSHDTFERVFNRLKPQAFQACFREWVQAITAALRIKHVAIDGKTLRGSGSAKLGPLHLVSAWATAQHLVVSPLGCRTNGARTETPCIVWYWGITAILSMSTHDRSALLPSPPFAADTASSGPPLRAASARPSRSSHCTT